MKKGDTTAKRVKRRAALIRKDDPFGRLTQEINRYLQTIGWTALVIGHPSIRGVEVNELGKYEFAVLFSGGRLKASPPQTERS